MEEASVLTWKLSAGGNMPHSLLANSALTLSTKVASFRLCNNSWHGYCYSSDMMRYGNMFGKAPRAT